MSVQSVVLISFLALVLLLGVVTVVALVRAERGDVPTVFEQFTRGFRRLVNAAPALAEQDETAPKTQTAQIPDVIPSQATAADASSDESHPDDSSEKEVSW